MYSRVVESLKILVLSAVTVASIVMPLMLTKINILFDADFGVIVADRPDISAKVVDAILAKLVLRVLITCTTDPAGNPVVVADVRMVPLFLPSHLNRFLPQWCVYRWHSGTKSQTLEHFCFETVPIL